jgi:hypothetical protein
MTPAMGWAVVERDVIMVRSCSDTRRGAVVNFLMASRGVIVLDWMDDELINVLWTTHKGDAESRAGDRAHAGALIIASVCVA